MQGTPSLRERKPPIRAVLFDAGNTLVRVATSVGRVYAEAAGRHGLPADGDELDRLFRAEFGRRRAGFVAGVSRPHSPVKEREWWRELLDDLFCQAGLRVALGEGFEAFFDDVYGAFEGPEVWEVFPDVLPCLDALGASGLPLGIVSNWDSRLHALLRGLGLAERFRFALTSAEFGAEKPHPSIFREAARRFGLPPEEVLHVGDLPRDDVEGALGAGLQAVLLDRACGAPADGAPRICHLGELSGLFR